MQEPTSTDRWRWSAASIFLSVLLHGSLFAAAVNFTSPFEVQARSAQSELAFQVLEPEPEPEPEPVVDPEPEPEPVVEPPEPPPTPIPERRIRRPDVTEEPPDEEPPPVEETPVAFDNLVLTNETGSSDWSTAQASGLEREGPVGGRGAVTGRNRDGEVGGAIDGTGRPSPGPRIVAVADLSRPPSPRGNLDSMLRRFYPEDAREQGIEGRAIVSIEVRPTGSVRVLAVVSQSRNEFGGACRRMLNQVRFDPPLDQAGTPVSTRFRFSCDFAIRN